MDQGDRVYPSVAELTVRATVAAGLRLVRESAAPDDGYRGRHVQAPGVAADVVGQVIGGQDVETFVVLMLDTRFRLMCAPVIVGRGTLDTCSVHPREVFRAAVLAGAAAVVLAHNHPSGDPTPSRDDQIMTETLVLAGGVLGVPVRDHIVYGSADRWVSFAERGLL